MQNMIDFISNTNVIEVRNATDFCRFIELLKKHKMIDILKEDQRSYNWWRSLAVLTRNRPLRRSGASLTSKHSTHSITGRTLHEDH